MTALYQLCCEGKLDEVRAALARGGDVNNKDSYGTTALMYAVWNSHNSIVKLLLEQPAVKVNEKDNLDGRTALYSILGQNHLSYVPRALQTPLYSSVWLHRRVCSFQIGHLH